MKVVTIGKNKIIEAINNDSKGVVLRFDHEEEVLKVFVDGEHEEVLDAQIFSKYSVHDALAGIAEIFQSLVLKMPKQELVAFKRYYRSLPEFNEDLMQVCRVSEINNDHKTMAELKDMDEIIASMKDAWC